MASRESIIARRKKLLDRLSDGSQVTIDELMQIGNAKRRTVLEDISVLRKSGNVIEIANGTARLKKITDVVVRPSRSVMRKIRIIEILNRHGGATRDQLLEDIKRDIDVADRNPKDSEMKTDTKEGEGTKGKTDFEKKADVERKNLDNDLKSLISEGIIYEEEGIYQISFSMPAAVPFEDKLVKDLHEMLANDAGNVLYSPILHSIAEKIETAWQYKLCGVPRRMADSVLVRDAKKEMDQYEGILKKIFELPFRTRKLGIRALNRRGEPYEKIIAVEKIVYLCDGESLYLIGLEHETARRSIIEFSRITDVAAERFKNTVYDNDEIKEICESMMKISVEEPHSVVVEFEDTEIAREQMEQLSETRKNASLNYRNGKIWYRDQVRGLYDMAKYLRRFGAACVVHEDEALRNRMMASSKRIIERYECGE